MRVDSVQAAWAFADDPHALLSVGPRIIELGKTLPGKVVQLSIPEDAPPDIPRMLVQSKNLVAAFARTRLDVTVRPPNQVATSLSQSFDYVRTIAPVVLTAADPSAREYRWAGIVATYRFPVSATKSAIEAAELAFDRVLRVERRGRSLSALNVQYGFFEGQFATILGIKGYEMGNVELGPVEPGQTIQFDRAALRQTESGIEITVDLNNKSIRREPSSPSMALQDFRELLALHPGALKSFLVETSLDTVFQ